MNTPRHLGETLSQLRLHVGWTQARVAAAIGRKRSTYAGWENDHMLPGREALSALAELFQVSTDQLIGNGNGNHPATEDETALLLCYRRLPATEAKAHLALIRARVGPAVAAE
jgi:transcriptional regulator with XRE-family HTH domain